MTPSRTPSRPSSRNTSRPGASSYLSGYVEGYYGRLLTFDERMGIVRKLKEIGAGHYLYAPKEDPWHRRAWRTPYPAAWRSDFRKFVEGARRLGVTVVPGVAPGQSFRYHHVSRGGEDYRTLRSKLFALTSVGCREAALLMDDIPVSLPHEDRHAFRSLGGAHGLLLSRLWPELRARGLRRLWFCPTVYSDFFAPEGVRNSAYLQDLAPHLAPGIELMWTGRAIVSPDYHARDLAALEAVTGARPVLWDNLYANDYCPGRLFNGPFAGRPASLRARTRGMLLNPTGLYHTDLFLLDLLGGYLRGEPPAASWRKAVAAAGIPRAFREVAPLMASPFVRLPAKAFTPARVAAWRAALKPLVWDWKSPLQREWYPYLYALDADLRLHEQGGDAPDEAWIRKKYSPVLAPLLSPAGRSP